MLDIDTIYNVEITRAFVPFKNRRMLQYSEYFKIIPMWFKSCPVSTVPYTNVVCLFYIGLNFFIGLLRLQQIYQGLQPGNETFQVETVKRISNVTMAISFLKSLEEANRWSRKFIVLDCPTAIAKEIVVSHVRDVSLGRRTYHYLLSGLVSIVSNGDVCSQPL